MGSISKRHGNEGEDLAAAYLSSHGFHILERQWHYRHFEIDIICEDLSTSQIVFVEVKTRQDESMGDPLDAIDRRKMARLSSAANHYIHETRCPLEWRFDVISIILHPYVEPASRVRTSMPPHDSGSLAPDAHALTPDAHALTPEELSKYPIVTHIPDAFYPPLCSRR